MNTIADGDVSANEFEGAGDETGTDAFLAHFTGDGDDDASKKKPSEQGNKEADEASKEQADDETDNTEQQSDESPDAEGEEGSEAKDKSEETEEKAKKFVEIDDNTFVKVKVGDEEIEVPVKDLTRVHGQEAALTRKSQEVAETRKKANDEIAKTVATLDVMLKRAKERATPFTQIDFLALTKDPNVSGEDLSNLRTAAQERFDEVRFLESELGNFMTAVQARQKDEFADAVKTCVTSLSTPGTDDKPNPLYIEGWNDKVYNDLRAFAVDAGLNKDTVNSLADPAAFKLIHMAMQFKRGAARVQTTKVNKTPTKIVKTSQSPVAQRTSPNKVKLTKTMDTLKRHQTVDAAGEAFLARFSQESDDE